MYPNDPSILEYSAEYSGGTLPRPNLADLNLFHFWFEDMKGKHVNGLHIPGQGLGVLLIRIFIKTEIRSFWVRKREFTINRQNYSIFFMPQNVFRRMHAKCIALAQTSFEDTRKHTKFMNHLFFRSGGIGLAVGEHFERQIDRHFMPSA